MNAALILSGGAGRRFGSALPKQYHKIGGRTVIEYVLDAAANARLVDRVMVAGADCPQLRALVHGNIRQNKRRHNAKERKAREQRAKQMEQKNKKKELI